MHIFVYVKEDFFKLLFNEVAINTIHTPTPLVIMGLLFNPTFFMFPLAVFSHQHSILFLPYFFIFKHEMASFASCTLYTPYLRQ